MLAGHKRAVGRVKQRVGVRKGGAKGVVAGQGHFRGGQKGVAPLLRCGGVTLHARGLHLEPKLAFFRHLDDVRLGRASIGHDVKIVAAEKMRRCFENVLQTEVAACFLVRHENKTQGKFGGNFVSQQLFCKQQHAHNGLLVVFHASPIQIIALAAHLPGIGCPGLHVSRRHNVSVAEKPQGAAAFAEHPGDEVGTLAIAHARIRRVNAGKGGDAAGLEPVRNAAHFLHLAVAAVFRPQRLAGCENGLKFRHAVFTSRQPAQKRIQSLEHGVSPMRYNAQGAAQAAP